jgi:hypothetical protein
MLTGKTIDLRSFRDHYSAPAAGSNASGRAHPLSAGQTLA